jgi:hypothetical protein
VVSYPPPLGLERAETIVLPLNPIVIRNYHPRPNWIAWLRGQRWESTQAMLEVFGRTKPVTVFPVDHYERCCEELGIFSESKKQVFPSSGFLATSWLMRKFPNAKINLFGFSFQGWKRHAWERERQALQSGSNIFFFVDEPRHSGEMSG